jgi:5-formyltetrahydrofolate cyclo-ligase
MHHIALRVLPGGLPRRRANRVASSWSKYALMTAKSTNVDSRHKPMDSSELSQAKVLMRQQAAARRLTAFRENPGAGDALAGRLVDAGIVPPGAIVSGYWPLDGEMDVRPALTALHGLGHVIGLPVVVAKNTPLLFRRWQPGMVLQPGPFRVLTPPDDSPEVQPRVLLVPLLAFDRLGYRLGYGGGFYDRTLAKLRASGHVLGIGIAFACQEVAEVPRGPRDHPIDFVATESEIITIENKKDT